MLTFFLGVPLKHVVKMLIKYLIRITFDMPLRLNLKKKVFPRVFNLRVCLLIKKLDQEFKAFAGRHMTLV